MPRSRMTTWKPRSSSLGGYFSCDQRAAFDRAISEGLLEAQPETGCSPYADLGTVTHFKLQKRLDCVFPHGEEPPTEDQIANAATLFAGNTEAMQTQITSLVELCAKHMPEAPDGKPWLAESAFSQPSISGHIDFLSQDRSTILDLKTTSRKPNHGRIKPAHLYQLFAYRMLAATKKQAPERAGVLYVDSLRAKWTCLIWVDFTTPEAQEFMEHIREYLKYIRGASLYRSARPRLGVHCEMEFCPHTARCRDTYLPPPSMFIEAAPLQAPSTFVSPL